MVRPVVRRPARSTLVIHAACAVLTLAVLAPVLAPGYVLTYDMVFVPRLPLTLRALGLTDELPRAVPQDAAVALAGYLVRGDLLQKAVLLATVYAAALGAARLVPTDRTAVRLVAAVGYGWSAYVAERLLIGHWGLLVCYAAAPWLVRAALELRADHDDDRSDRRRLARLVLVAAPACLTPTGGVVAAGVAGTLLCWPGARSTRQVRLAGFGGVLLYSLPWLVAGALVPGRTATDPDGVAAFAARGETWAGPVGAVLSLGGVWNADAVPASRGGWLAPLLAAVTVALAVAGLSRLRTRWGNDAAPVLATAAAGLLLALAGVTPGLRETLERLVEVAPGAGLLRDGQKFLIPYAVVLALAAALGAERVAEWLGGRVHRVGAVAALAGALVLPVASMPDLAWGAFGRLAPVAYPADWQRAAAVIDDRPGELVVLPFGSFRTFGWNDGRTVLDPAERYFRARVVTDDRLFVRTGGRTLDVAGESTRARQVRAVLAADRPLADLGVRWVLVYSDVPGAVPTHALDGLRPAMDGGSLRLYENQESSGMSDIPISRQIALLAANLLAILLVIAAVGAGVVRPKRPLHQRSTDW